VPHHREPSNTTEGCASPGPGQSPNPNGDSITDYERVRQENIERNQQFLRELGLAGASLLVPEPVVEPASGARKHKVRRRAEREIIPREILPRRVQPRRGVKGSQTSGLTGDGVEEEQVSISGNSNENESDSEQKPTEFDDSSVLQYLLSTAVSTVQTVGSDGEKSEVNPSSQQSATLQPIRFNDPSFSNESRTTSSPNTILQSVDLTAVYSMDFHRDSRLFVAGGKGGNVAVFALPEYRMEANVATARVDSQQTPTIVDDSVAVYDPLLVFRAHNRWVSCTKFLSMGGRDSDIRLLSAADDGVVKLWDLAQTSQQQTAKVLATSSCGHANGRGIFSLDERQGELITGSKDRTVCVSRVSPLGDITPMTQFSELHDGVVKSVSWQGGPCRNSAPSTFASGGQDQRVCVKDIRSGFGASASSADVEITGAHAGGVHTVLWCPHDHGEHWLATAGYDGLVNVFDIRATGALGRAEANSATPLFCFREHQAPSGPKRKKSSTILTPCFLSQSSLLIPSEYSGALSMHCLLTGSTISRGVLSSDNAIPISVAAVTNSTRNSMYVVAASNRKGAMHILCADN
jgi:WD40 repeat protein